MKTYGDAYMAIDAIRMAIEQEREKVKADRAHTLELQNWDAGTTYGARSIIDWNNTTQNTIYGFDEALRIINTKLRRMEAAGEK